MRNLFRVGFKVLFFPAIVFLVHVLLTLGFDIYGVWPSFDIIAHFLGGLSIGVSTNILLIELERRRQVHIVNVFWQVFFVLSVTALVAVAWEWHEWLLDRLLGTSVQLSIDDTMLDLFLGACGGSVAAIVGAYNKKRN